MTNEIFRAVHLQGMQVHAFVLMANHFHLIATFPDDSISAVMQNLLRETAKYINGYRGTMNQVFGGPYKACIIKNNAYLLNVLKYVWFNPVVAGIVHDPRLYEWSSLRQQMGLAWPRFPIIEKCTIMPSVTDKDFDEWITLATCWCRRPAYSETGAVLRRTEFKYPGKVLERIPELKC